MKYNYKPPPCTFTFDCITHRHHDLRRIKMWLIIIRNNPDILWWDKARYPENKSYSEKPVFSHQLWTNVQRMSLPKQSFERTPVRQSCQARKCRSCTLIRSPSERHRSTWNQWFDNRWKNEMMHNKLWIKLRRQYWKRWLSLSLSLLSLSLTLSLVRHDFRYNESNRARSSSINRIHEIIYKVYKTI